MATAIKAVLIGSLVVVGACAPTSTPVPTGLQRADASGTVEKISYFTDTPIDAGTVQRYVLYRAARIAQEKHKKFFLIYDGLNAVSNGQAADLPAVGALGNRTGAYTFVRMADRPLPGAKDTDRVLEELEPEVRQRALESTAE